MAIHKASVPPTLSVKGNFAHPTVTGLCSRCPGVTTRAGLCGICHALEFGMTDDQVDLALDRLTASTSPRLKLVETHGC